MYLLLGGISQVVLNVYKELLTQAFFSFLFLKYIIDSSWIIHCFLWWTTDNNNYLFITRLSWRNCTVFCNIIFKISWTRLYLNTILLTKVWEKFCQFSFWCDVTYTTSLWAFFFLFSFFFFLSFFFFFFFLNRNYKH